jgi:hypothetical protein
LQVWEKHGVAGIEKLRGKLKLGDLDGGYQRMMSLSWGADHLGFELDFKAAGAVSSVAAAAAQKQNRRVSAATQLPLSACREHACMRQLLWTQATMQRNAPAQTLLAQSSLKVAVIHDDG